MIEDFSPFEVNFDSQIPASIDDLFGQDFSSGLGLDDDNFEPILPNTDFPGDVPVKDLSFENAPVPELPTKPPAAAKEEPESIRKWREDMEEQLKIKDAQEEVKKEELRLTAQKELADWYVRYDEMLVKCKAANRSGLTSDWLTARDQPPPEGTPEWEHIARMCDFNAKAMKNGKDVSRMRAIILQLKQNPSLGFVSPVIST